MSLGGHIAAVGKGTNDGVVYPLGTYAQVSNGDIYLSVKKRYKKRRKRNEKRKETKREKENEDEKK